MEAFSPASREGTFEILICGVGPGATALELVRFLERKGPHTVILAGVAGGYRGSGVELEDVCIAASEAYGDLGRCVTDRVEPLEISGEVLPTTFPLEAGWRPLFPTGFLDGLGVREVPMVSVSCASGTRERAGRLRSKFGACAENMEGAAAAQVCAAYGLPLVEIRGISNWAGDLEHRNWKMGNALRRTAVVVGAVIAHLGGG
jgi:futalosine hydrolase